MKEFLPDRLNFRLNCAIIGVTLRTERASSYCAQWIAGAHAIFENSRKQIKNQMMRRRFSICGNAASHLVVRQAKAEPDVTCFAHSFVSDKTLYGGRQGRGVERLAQIGLFMTACAKKAFDAACAAKVTLVIAELSWGLGLSTVARVRGFVRVEICADGKASNDKGAGRSGRYRLVAQDKLMAQKLLCADQSIEPVS